MEHCAYHVIHFLHESPSPSLTARHCHRPAFRYATQPPPPPLRPPSRLICVEGVASGQVEAASLRRAQ
eukprot:3048257-Pleurochrysis_carterae.AAC.1